MFDKNHPMTVKLIGTKRYEVEMFLMPNDSYCIRYQNKWATGSDYSENIFDYRVASMLFDIKVKELEGN